MEGSPPNNETGYTESLDGVQRLQIDCESVHLIFESAADLDNVVQLVTAPGDSAPELRRIGRNLVVYQRGTYLPLPSATPLIRVPFRRCPPIVSGAGATQVSTRVRSQLTFRLVNADIEARHGVGNITIEGGTGSFSSISGEGDLTVTDHDGSLSSRAGRGNVLLKRFSGPVLLEHGIGDIAAIECTGDLFVESGVGTVDVIQPNKQRLSIYARTGNIRIVEGDLVAARIHTGDGDIVCDCRLVANGDAASPHRRIKGLRATKRDGVAIQAPQIATFEIETGKGVATILLAPDIPLRVEAIAEDGFILSGLPLLLVRDEGTGTEGSIEKIVGNLQPVDTSDSGWDLQPTLRIRSHGGIIRLYRNPLNEQQENR